VNSRPIIFEAGRTDVVTAVVIPVDGVTRLPVRSGVDVQLWDPVDDYPLPVRIVRNLSGRLVLLNEPADQELSFRVDGRPAGFQGPLFVTFNPAQDGRSRVVLLARRPDSDFGETATLVRGSVVRSAGDDPPGPVSGLTVSARPQAGSAGPQFPATTDERGVFALVVGLRLVSVNEPAPVPTTIHFEKDGLPVREFDVDIEHGRTHVFAEPVDLDSAVRPAFQTPPKQDD
jgi:hypothetical protein